MCAGPCIPYEQLGGDSEPTPAGAAAAEAEPKSSASYEATPAAGSPVALAKADPDFEFPYSGRPRPEARTPFAGEASDDPNRCHWRGWYKCGNDPWRDFWGNGATCDDALLDALDWAEDLCGGTVAYNQFDCNCD